MAVDQNPPAMKAFGFSPVSAPSLKQSPPARMGVPGHKRYPQNWRILFMWTGSSFQRTFTSSPLVYFYIGLIAISASVFSSVEYTPALQGTMMPARFFGPITSVVTFMLTFVSHITRDPSTSAEFLRISLITDACVPCG